MASRQLGPTQRRIEAGDLIDQPRRHPGYVKSTGLSHRPDPTVPGGWPPGPHRCRSRDRPPRRRRRPKPSRSLCRHERFRQLPAQPRGGGSRADGRFLHDVLDFEIDFEEIEMGLVLLHRDAVALAVVRTSNPGDKTTAGYISVTDVDDLHSRCKARGHGRQSLDRSPLGTTGLRGRSGWPSAGVRRADRCDMKPLAALAIGGPATRPQCAERVPSRYGHSTRRRGAAPQVGMEQGGQRVGLYWPRAARSAAKQASRTQSAVS